MGFTSADDNASHSAGPGTHYRHPSIVKNQAVPQTLLRSEAFGEGGDLVAPGKGEQEQGGLRLVNDGSGEGSEMARRHE